MTQPTEDPVARADAIKAELFREMTLENTPVAFIDDRWGYEDEEGARPISEANRSAELEKELHDLYHSDPDAFRGSEYESWFAPPADPDRPDETFLDDDRYLDAEGPGDPFMDEESDADRAADAAWQEYQGDLGPALTDADLDATWEGHDPSVGRNLDELANPDLTRESDPPPWGPDADPDAARQGSDADRAADAAWREYLADLDNPAPGAAATPDVASFDALDAWRAEADRTGDAGAADAYAFDFQDAADRAAAGAEDADLARRDPEPG